MPTAKAWPSLKESRMRERRAKLKRAPPHSGVRSMSEDSRKMATADVGRRLSLVWAEAQASIRRRENLALGGISRPRLRADAAQEVGKQWRAGLEQHPLPSPRHVRRAYLEDRHWREGVGGREESLCRSAVGDPPYSMLLQFVIFCNPSCELAAIRPPAGTRRTCCRPQRVGLA